MVTLLLHRLLALVHTLQVALRAAEVPGSRRVTGHHRSWVIQVIAGDQGARVTGKNASS